MKADDACMSLLITAKSRLLSCSVKGPRHYVMRPPIPPLPCTYVAFPNVRCYALTLTLYVSLKRMAACCSELMIVSLTTRFDMFVSLAAVSVSNDTAPLEVTLALMVTESILTC